MKLTIGDLRVIKAALDTVPSYVLEEQHRTRYDATRLSYLFGIEIDRNTKRKEIADRQEERIKKAKAELIGQATFNAEKSSLEKKPLAKGKNEAPKPKLEFPSLNLKGKSNGKKTVNKRNRKDRG